MKLEYQLKSLLTLATRINITFDLVHLDFIHETPYHILISIYLLELKIIYSRHVTMLQTIRYLNLIQCSNIGYEDFIDA